MDRSPSLLRILIVAACLLGSAVAGAEGNSLRYVEYGGGKIYLWDIPGCWATPELSIALFDMKAEKNLDRVLGCWRYQGNRIVIFRSNDELPITIDRDLELYETSDDARPVVT